MERVGSPETIAASPGRDTIDERRSIENDSRTLAKSRLVFEG